MNVLQLECTKCRVAVNCPERGASPLTLRSGKKVLCSVIGGYGRVPVDKIKLSVESAERAEKDGPCITIAEVPVIDPDSGSLYRKVTKIFHQPILHERETTTFHQDMVYPKSHR